MINDNYFCRIVLPQQQMLPLASRRNRTHAGSAICGALMVGEDQAPGGIPAPGLHPSLEGPKAPRGELAGVLRPQPLGKLLGGPIRLYIQPGSDARPDGLERIGSGPPVASRPGLHVVRRPDLAFLPRGCQARQELLQVWIASGRDADSRPG